MKQFGLHLPSLSNMEAVVILSFLQRSIDVTLDGYPCGARGRWIVSLKVISEGAPPQLGTSPNGHTARGFQAWQEIPGYSNLILTCQLLPFECTEEGFELRMTFEGLAVNTDLGEQVIGDAMARLDASVQAFFTRPSFGGGWLMIAGRWNTGVYFKCDSLPG